MLNYILQTFQSEQQSAHSSVCEVLQSSSVTVTHKDEPCFIEDASLTTGTCNITAPGKMPYIIVIFIITYLATSSGLLQNNGSRLCHHKLKFHWDQFPRNFPVANVTGKLPTSYEEVGRVASLLRGSYEEAGDFQTISTCQDGLACR